MSRDLLIEELLSNSLYDIRDDGTVWTKVGIGGVVKDTLRQTGLSKTEDGYLRFGYKKHDIRVHRLIYRKYHGPLIPNLIVDHIDSNRVNNLPNNLQQITNRENVIKGKSVELCRQLGLRRRTL